MCQLSDAEKREREATLLARFKSAAIVSEELDDGYSFRLPGEKDWLAGGASYREAKGGN